ncbi:PIG-L family deacetylase [Luteipulveratus mongoliensis]|uniref:1D-myo-inositol 2-acetamido-2-deoxy-alpha-D-glucopyranoside deacetylase n=1 Tax=Luteipulveratus mongoliensis TaxID=571913 RepID=A0A0K1JLS4_9MICO|nr:PIG-L family deacetylase [Luteipulveratus mongoliensis]AKU17661.1 1D-myo-inositol 2-acetamido-2-deoxy-alpha-D-glucopyranoside deacetylase [Luteipulveratus mongoliensis]
MRLLFVHAHPDDESLWTGVSLAHHVADGDEVHVLTMTLGEEGEVIPPELAHLELPPGEPRDPDAQDPLGALRREELRDAMAYAGVTSSVVLGEDDDPVQLADPERALPRYRDSGMAGTPSVEHPSAFVRADLDDAAEAVAAHIRRVDADVVVTYDANGGYGHPDHIQTHRVTRAAVQLVERTPRLMVILTPQSWASQDRSWLKHVPEARLRADRLELPPEGHAAELSVVPDDVVTHATVDPSAVATQRTALGAHRTQVRVFDDCFALSNDVAVRLAGREGFAEIDPATGSLLKGNEGARRGLTEEV